MKVPLKISPTDWKFFLFTAQLKTLRYDQATFKACDNLNDMCRSIYRRLTVLNDFLTTYESNLKAAFHRLWLDNFAQEITIQVTHNS